MAFPFPSFGSFLFTRDEASLWDSDSFWNRSPSYARSRPLGSNSDNSVLMAIGSAERSFECYLSPSRFTTLEALVGTVGSFTDWDRPVPTTRNALLSRIEQRGRAPVTCSDGVTRLRIRTGVFLISQT